MNISYTTSKNTTIRKPPLGVSPAYIIIEARIKELGEAIGRYDGLTQTTDQIRSWAKEIIIYCDTSDAIKNIQKETKTEESLEVITEEKSGAGPFSSTLIRTYCPKCHSQILEFYCSDNDRINTKYCYNCGQRLKFTKKTYN